MNESQAQSAIRQQMIEVISEEETLTFLDPPWQFDDAIVGVLNFDGFPRVLYDYSAVFEALVRDMGESDEDEVHEYIGFNIASLAAMRGGPLLIMARRRDNVH